MRWKVLGAVIFAVLIVAFTLANSTDVSVDFIVTKARVNLVLVILLSVLLGMILIAILWSIHAWRLRSEIRAGRRRIAELEDRLRALDSGPIISADRASAHAGPGLPPDPA
ncbi:lipopolysaccharide assembly protein LapA domain-containing protein [Alicyclobacillus fructus]|uniref:lipopolysaccharide assembly protein LapA domain-containing protein n=1 Tax=Alicyclobacillus fructus TaxID=2816082 RepID=UPI001A8DD05A|nr:lipopolysaccharide assembly protein LapA domain-containing protein [Alicyclobacillus fructus]